MRGTAPLFGALSVAALLALAVPAYAACPPIPEQATLDDVFNPIPQGLIEPDDTVVIQPRGFTGVPDIGCPPGQKKTPDGRCAQVPTF
ncbi:hypothetical protein [Nonomuraea endophytica]|uniref:Uncharacterized protein n=1 Tax=Nonomuraea endophytica TaxID=714136 RepID=A0A7W8EFP3_9ACTN|nr:hypothetical protein [Nonomuraea endophytica]MBB5077784.1 hypothetical protein [Nonomuraea endophytica]